MNKSLSQAEVKVSSVFYYYYYFQQGKVLERQLVGASIVDFYFYKRSVGR